LIEAITIALMIVGTAFALVSSIGLGRLPDFYTRLHGPTKAATLGVGCVLLAAVVYFTLGLGQLSVRESLAIIFIFMTSPVGSHMIAKAALKNKIPFHPDTKREDLPPRDV
jgi:multicomponent K+:H+ antiporter subunit G